MIGYEVGALKVESIPLGHPLKFLSLEENCMKKTYHNLMSQMPDLKFVRFCEEEYGINRGIYNTVDEWFDEQGIREIVRRREIILDFFKSLELNEDEDGKIKFGSKGLKGRLDHFFEEKQTLLNT